MRFKQEYGEYDFTYVVGSLQSGAHSQLHKKLNVMHVQHDLKQRGVVSLNIGFASPVCHSRPTQGWDRNSKSSWLLHTPMRGSAKSVSIMGALATL